MAIDDFTKSLRGAAASVAQGAREFGSDVSDSVSGAAEDGRRLKRFTETGSDLFITGMTTTHGGNMSESDGSHIWITRRDSMLGHLANDDIITTSWDPEGHDDKCSRELVVHRAMHHAYLQREGAETGSHLSAIVHAHTRNTILRSLLADEIEPIDSEGLYVFKEKIRIYAPAQTVESVEAAGMLEQAVRDGADIAVIKGHGPFAIGPSIEEAFRLVSVLEASCDILNRWDACVKSR